MNETAADAGTPAPPVCKQCVAGPESSFSRATMCRVPTPTPAAARHLRAAVVGAWAVLGAGLAHSSQIGGPPSLVAVVPAVGATWAAAWWVGGQRLRFTTTFALLAFSQVSVHLLTAYVHGHAMTPSGAMVLAHLASAALVALGIAKAEKVLWSCWDRAVRQVPRLPATFAGLAASWAPTGAHAVPRAALLGHEALRRGPPTD